MPAARSASTLGAWAVLAFGCAVESPERQATVLYASGADLQSINPLIAVHPLAKQVQNHVLFMTLAEYDSDFVARPRLARWTWNDARSVLTFHLRHDVHWHDGVATTASDAAWTLDMARSPETGYPRARDLDAVVSVAAVDSFTLRVSFDRPQPVFPDVFADLAILPAHAFRGAGASEIRTHAFNRAPVGNGPFRFVEYRPNQRWVFERVPTFPADLVPPRFDRFVVVIVDEAATKLAALTSGELDFAGVNPAHAAFVDADPALEIVDYPILFAVALVWNLRRPPFDSRDVREALTAALDRRLLVDAYLFGYGEVADGPVSPGHPWYEPVPGVPYDPVDAGRRLDEAGWVRGPDGVREKSGRRLAFDLLAVSSGDNALEQLIQAQLAEVGVEVRLRPLELSTFLEVAQSERRDFDALVVGVPGDPMLGHVVAMFGGGGGPVAYPGYRSEEFDAAVGAVRRASSADAIQDAWRRAQRVLARDLPTTWLYHSRGVQGKRRRVRATPPDLRGELARLREWSIDGRSRQ